MAINIGVGERRKEKRAQRQTEHVEPRRLHFRYRCYSGLQLHRSGFMPCAKRIQRKQTILCVEDVIQRKV